MPAEGVACNHHFLLSEDGTDFRLSAGNYTLRVYAKKVAVAAPIELASVRLGISESHAKSLEAEDSGISFDWGPDQQAYHGAWTSAHPNPCPFFSAMSPERHSARVSMDRATGGYQG